MGWVFKGSAVKEIRQGMGLSAQAFAEALGISRQTITEIENESKGRKPNVSFLEKVMERFPIMPMKFFRPSKVRKNGLIR